MSQLTVSHGNVEEGRVFADDDDDDDDECDPIKLIRGPHDSNSGY
jgi:hypothetical protein